MTIKHNGRIVSFEMTFPPKSAMVGALFGGPWTTKIRLFPPEEVYVEGSWGSRTVQGDEINRDETCRSNGIRYYPERGF